MRIEKKDKVGVLHSPRYADHRLWSDWTAKYLPHGKNYWITDVDGVHRDRFGNLMLIERKCKGAKVQGAQKITFQILHYQLKAGFESTEGRTPTTKGVIISKYFGFNCITWDGPEYTGQIHFNKIAVSISELVGILTFQPQHIAYFINHIGRRPE